VSVPPEAVAAAAEAIRQHTGHRVSAELATAALEAAAPHIVAASRGQETAGWDLVRDDIDALLRVLGLGDGLARPHEDMRAAIAEASRLRALARPPAEAEAREQAAARLMEAFPVGPVLAGALAEIVLQAAGAEVSP
jgi:hypothetical protein